MEFNSGFLDSLKLLLKDKYVVSDEELMSLSDILINLGLVDIAERGILTSLIYFMDSNNLRFPISYEFMKSEWEKTSRVLNFKSLLSRFELDKLIVLKKMKEDTFFNSQNINKDISLDVVGKPYYLVVFGTSTLKQLLKSTEDNKLLTVKRLSVGDIVVTEGINFGTMDRKYKEFVARVSKLVTTKLFTNIDFESYEYDSVKNEIEFNSIIKIPQMGKLKNSDLVRIFKKWTKGSMTLSVNSYIDNIDSKTTVGDIYFNIKVDMRIMPADLKSLADNIVSATNEIITTI